jgi:hypothetical protein
MRYAIVVLALISTILACERNPADPGSIPVQPELFAAAVMPAGSSVQLNAQANAESNSTADPATVTDTDTDVQASTTAPLSVSVLAATENGGGTLQASGGITATWVDPDAGQVVWNVAWSAANLPASAGGLVRLPAIDPGDGWIYTFTADADGQFVLDYDIAVGGSNTFGLNPFNFLWLPPGAPFPEQTSLSPATTGSVTMEVTAGQQYTVRLTNNSGLTTTGGAISDRAANMTATFDWRIAPALIVVEIDIKPGSDPNCFNNDGHGVIPVAILGSADFDVTSIDPATVALESLAVRAAGRKGNLQAHIEDVNGDGFADLVVQIEDSDGAFNIGSGTATLTGQLLDGTPFEGTDDICIVPPT